MLNYCPQCGRKPQRRSDRLMSWWARTGCFTFPRKGTAMDYCYLLENGRRVFVPNVMIPREDLHRYTPVPLRGYAYTMACVNNNTGEIDGWCKPEDFGFSTVREWMKAQEGDKE